MTIKEYVDFDEEEITGLYKSVGWSNYYGRPQMLKAAYSGSLVTLGAYDEKRLVGVIRVVGDGASIIYIQDILVHPHYQRRGIGTALMRAVQERFESVYQIVLMTDDTLKTAAFYRSCGFKPCDETGCRGFLKC